MRVYTKLHGFENVFDTDECVDVGADGNDKELRECRDSCTRSS